VVGTTTRMVSTSSTSLPPLSTPPIASRRCHLWEAGEEEGEEAEPAKAGGRRRRSLVLVVRWVKRRLLHHQPWRKPLGVLGQEEAMEEAGDGEEEEEAEEAGDALARA